MKFHLKPITLITIIILCSVSSVAKSDTFFGVYINAQQWFYNYSGDVRGDSLGNFDLENDLKFGNQSATSVSVAVEHPAPMVPNFKLRHNEFSHRATNSLTNLSSNIDLNHTDLTLYYELLDNWVNLDLGLSLMYFDNSTSFSNPLGSSKINRSKIVPALYGKAQFEFPITDLSANITVNATQFSGYDVFDVEISALYELGLGFGLEAGYRRKALEFDDFGDLNLNTTGSGLFAGLQFHF